MRVIRISSLNFLGKIIDSHTHVGTHDGGNYTKQDLDIFVKSELPNKDTIEKMFVSDLDVLHSKKNEYEGNKAILQRFKDSSEYEFFAACNPKDGDVKNIKKLFKEYPNKFIGLKFHSDIQQLDLSDKRYEPYMEFAQKNNIPCLFHSQVNVMHNGKINPNQMHISDPESIYNLAKKYPKVPVVLAHMGAGFDESHDKAIDVIVKSIKDGDANLYADISWVDIDAGNKDHVVKAIKRLKGINDSTWKYGDQSHRLMFGTDAPLARFKNNNSKESISNYTRFIEDIKQAIKTDKDLSKDSENIIDDLFYNNAKKLYLTSSKKKFICLRRMRKNPKIDKFLRFFKSDLRCVKIRLGAG